MLFDLNKLHGSREHVDRTFQPSAFDPQDEDYRVVAPVELSMDAEKASSGTFNVTGRVRTRLELTCSRCVEPFEVPVDSTFDLRYVPQTQNAGEGEHEIADDDANVRIGPVLSEPLGVGQEFRVGVAVRHGQAAL